MWGLGSWIIPIWAYPSHAWIRLCVWSGEWSLLQYLTNSEGASQLQKILIAWFLNWRHIEKDLLKLQPCPNLSRLLVGGGGPSADYVNTQSCSIKLKAHSGWDTLLYYTLQLLGRRRDLRTPSPSFLWMVWLYCGIKMVGDLYSILLWSLLLIWCLEGEVVDGEGEVVSGFGKVFGIDDDHVWFITI